MNKKITCSVVGARGYAGLETARLLLRHPFAQLTHCFATSEFKLTDYLHSAGAKDVTCLRDDEVMNHLTDVVFLATPAEVSLKLAPKILAAGKKVVDLSGAFRLKKNDYQAWYGFEHTQSAELAQSHYGLLPWARPTSADSFVANPGCYATAISLALIPVVKEKLIHTGNVVVDAKSGTTGAGRKASENLLFAEVEGECLPYKIGRHQHLPEIAEAVEAFAGKKVEVQLVTSLLPVRRGIIANLYANLVEGVGIDEVKAAFAKAYDDYPLVSHGEVKDSPDLLSLKKVVGTAKAHISYEVVGRKLFLFSCIDNLMKGAAAQAIENFNQLSDLPALTGVDRLEALI